MSKIKKTILGAVLFLIGVPFTVYAVQVTVPSAPTSGYALVSSTTGNYVTKLLPSCSSASNALTFSTASNGFGCNTITGGSGSGGGTWSTTTSQVPGQFINYPNNTTDIPCIGGTATSTCKFYFDPNTSKAFLVSASTTDFSSTNGIGSPYIYDLSNTKRQVNLSAGNITNTTGTVEIDWQNESLNGASGINQVDWGLGALTNGGVSVVDWNGQQLRNSSNDRVLDWNTLQLQDQSEVASLNWDNRTLNDTSGTAILNFGGPTLSTPGPFQANVYQYNGGNSFVDGSGNIYLIGGHQFVDTSGNTDILGTLTVDGLADGCATIASHLLNSTGIACGSGSGSGFSTTSTDYWLTVNRGNAFSTTSADAYINASSTIAHPSGGAFGSLIEWNGSRWISVATSTLNLNFSNMVGTVALTSQVTGVLPIANGGTNASSFTTSGNAAYYTGSALATAPLTSAVTTPYASTTALSAQTLCLTGDTCRTTWPSSGGGAYPFQLSGNATSTLTQFNGGITALASSTIGPGGNVTGLTVNGNAVTTGTITVNGTATSTIAGTTTIANALYVGTSTATNLTQIGAFSVNSNGNVGLSTSTQDSTLDVYGTVRFEGLSATTSPSISGGITGIGCDTSDMAGFTSLASTTAFITTPQSYPGAGVFFYTVALTSTAARVYVCSDVTVTPNASTYNIRIIR